MHLCHRIAKAVMAALAILLLVVSFSACSPSGDESVSGRALTSYESDGGASGDWMEAASLVASRQLSTSSDGVIVLPAVMEPDLIRLASTSVLLGEGFELGPAQVERAYDSKVDLYRVADYPDLYSTFMVVQANRTLATKALQQGVERRLRRLADAVTSGRAGAASEFRYGLAVLASSGGDVNAVSQLVDPCAGLERGVDQGQLLMVDTFWSIAGSASCLQELAPAIEALALADFDGDPGDVFVYAELYAQARLRAAVGVPVEVHPGCTRLLSTPLADGFTPMVSPVDVLHCWQIALMAEEDAELSDGVRARLLAEWATQGRLPQRASTNPRGAAYQLAALRILGFRDDVLSGLRVVAPSEPASAPFDEVMFDLAAGSASSENWETLSLQQRLSPEQLFTLSELAVSTGTCGDGLLPSLRRIAPGLAIRSARSVHEGALVAVAMEVCSSASLEEARELSRRIIRAVKALDFERLDAVSQWRLAEATCITEGQLPMGRKGIINGLPDTSSPFASIEYYDEFYASVRLAEMTQIGC